MKDDYSKDKKRLESMVENLSGKVKQLQKQEKRRTSKSRDYRSGRNHKSREKKRRKYFLMQDY